MRDINQIYTRTKRSPGNLDIPQNDTLLTTDSMDNTKHEEKRAKQKLPCTVSTLCS